MQISGFSWPCMLHPQQTVSLFNITFHTNVTQPHFPTDIYLHTNTSVYKIPLYVYHGRLKVSRFKLCVWIGCMWSHFYCLSGISKWPSGVVVTCWSRSAKLTYTSGLVSSGFSSRCETFILVCNQPPRSTQPSNPSWVGAVSTSQRAVTSCSMVRVWVAGKTVWSPCYTRAISDQFRDGAL